MSTKKSLKRKKAKERRQKLKEQQAKIRSSMQSKKGDEETPIEYIVEKIPQGIDSQAFESMREVFAKFAERGIPKKDTPKEDKKFPAEQQPKEAQLAQKIAENASDDEEPGEETRPRLSNKKRKLRDRLTVAQLKQLVDRPDLVELHDPNSPDPTLLVHLKSARNTVPVPAHWLDKRRYLQSKRGVEKAVFQLPKAVQETGVGELRRPGRSDSLKSRQRQRMNPRLGRLDVDYQKLHAAFFKNMVKPRMTGHGDVYHLGKENEVRYRRHRPGALSKRLKNALHMMEGFPPPYLVNMQRFGPPPSYTQLRIPGLNAPIPPGCKYGYGEGQWGKPPVNENGYPMHGDPFGVNSVYEPDEGSSKVSQLWGDVDENVAYEDDFDDEEMEEDAEAPEAAEAGEAPLALNATEVAEAFERQQKAIEPEQRAATGEEKQLFRVLGQKAAQPGEAAMGSAHTYDLAAEEKARKAPGSGKGGVSVALDEAELASLDEMTIKLKYDEAVRAGKASPEDEKALARSGRKKRPKRRKDELADFKF